MSMRMTITLSAFIVLSTIVASEASSSQLKSMATARAMERVFARSEKAHSQSMASIMKSMSPQKAWQVLAKHNLTTPALIEVSSTLQGKHGKNLRKHKAAPAGYAGLDGARKLLNDMIFESKSKYDQETARCTSYYSSQCTAMEAGRSQIAGANYAAADARAKITDAQSKIDRANNDIPQGETELKAHKKKCAEELEKYRQRRSELEADIQLMEDILQLTDCKSTLVQTKMKKTALLRCENPCTKKSFVTFDHDELKQKISQLQSSSSHKLLQHTFSDLYDGIQSMESISFLQLDAEANNVSSPPSPRSGSESPCDDEYAGAPPPYDKRSGKCTLVNTPACDQLQERFLLIQSGIKDDREALLLDIDSMKEHRDSTSATLQKQIRMDEEILDESSTELAQGEERLAKADEKARQTAIKNNELDDDLRKQMKSCSENYINFEAEVCALKKIRGELLKLGENNQPVSMWITDCEVGPWEPEECSKPCTPPGEMPGTQNLVRTVLTQQENGAQCLPLGAIRSCSTQPCPVDCKMGEWGGWSKCSAECGGGVRQRLRLVKTPAKYDGQPCQQNSQTETCNGHACEVDCGLTEWTKWSWCSKDCDGGTRKRVKFVTKQAEGQGQCPDRWDEKRLEYRKCNEDECLGASAKKAGQCSTWDTDDKFYTCATLPSCCSGHQGLGKTANEVQCNPANWASDATFTTNCGPQAMKCDQKLDIVLLLDGSGSLGQAGWDAEIKAANTFVDSFAGAGKAQMGVILYSGPSTYSAVYRCFDYHGTTALNMETDCKIKRVTDGFSSDMADVKTKISALTWPKGSTLTSLALLTANTMMREGREDTQSVIVVITDGRPFSYRATRIVSRWVRRSARLIWVPVTRYAPLRQIKKWATRRWEENVVNVADFETLEQPWIVTQLVADICPTHALTYEPKY